jgi:hypothetical protein
VGAVPAQARSDRDRVVAGYFASWDIYGRGYFPKQIPADHVSHLNYAFAYPVGPNDRYGYEDGTCAPADIWADFQQVHWSGDTSVDGIADDPPTRTSACSATSTSSASSKRWEYPGKDPGNGRTTGPRTGTTRRCSSRSSGASSTR